MRRPLLLCLLAMSALLASPASAERLVPVFRPLQVPGQLITSTRTAPVCQLGVPGPAVSAVSYVLPPDDRYYTLLDTGDAGCAGAGGVALEEAHIAVEFSYAYDTPVRIGIVAADLSDPGCPKPLPGVYLCPPVEYSLAGPGTGAYDVALPLPPGCTLTGKAFLEITFTEWGFSYEAPALLITGECEPCTSFNYFPGDDYDLCTFGFEGNPVMYVTGSSESVVPVRGTTWGRIKSYHR